MPNLPYSSQANQAFGGKVVTINATTFVARNWKPEYRTRKIRRDDENGDQAAFMLRAEPVGQTGLTLQMANANVARPYLGNTFADPDDANVSYVVTSVGPSKPQGEFHTVDIDYERVTSNGLPTD